MAHDNAVIYVTEGQDETVTCMAESVFPRPVFTWSLSGGSPGHIAPLDSQPRVSISPSSYLLTSYTTVRLNITSIPMNKSILTCQTKQYDYTGRLLYSTNTSLTIRALPHQPPVLRPSASQTSHGASLLSLLLLSLFVISTGMPFIYVCKEYPNA